MKMTKEGMGDEAMKKSLFYRAKKMPPSAQIMLLFAVEGVFLQYITSINGFGLNLYATNMGATDSQIGIIQMVPNIVACAALLPLGILADHCHKNPDCRYLKNQIHAHRISFLSVLLSCRLNQKNDEHSPHHHTDSRINLLLFSQLSPHGFDPVIQLF